MRSQAIVFVGMDGAGKTTLSRTLESDLRNQGKEIRHVWILENEQSLLRRLLRKAANRRSPISLEARHLSGTPGEPVGFPLSIMRKIYLAAVVLDYLVYGLLRIRLPFLWGRRRVWIFDRYFFDIILSLSDEFSLTKVQYIWMWSLLGRVFPSPDTIFFVDVEPELAVLRKPDAYSSVDAAVIMRQKYMGLLDALNRRYGSRVLRIDNNRGSEESYEGIRKGIQAQSG
jgi:thymidylate kinase